MRHAVLDGRVTIPLVPPRHISRTRLLQALDASVKRPLTLIAAGPGSGKSVLLADWAALQEPKPAWASLDEGDNNPARFWSLIAVALRAAGVTSEPDPPVDSGTSDVLHSLIARDEGAPTVLILDDAPVITDREILDGLDECIRFSRGRVRLVIAARSDPLLPLHRYRLSGTIAELRAADLAMTNEESRALLAAYGVRLPAREFQVLTARTEGWVAGMRLSAMRMEGSPRPAEFVTDLALDQGSVGEYLIDEVLNRQPSDVRQLLMETSFLNVVSGPVAEAVTGLAGAQTMLAELSRSNSFVTSLDRKDGTYRYHRLLAEILRYLLRREPAEHQRALSRRAARWFADSGDLNNALRHSASAEDWAFAAHVLATGGFTRALAERVSTRAVSGTQLLADLNSDDGCTLERTVAAAALLARDGAVEQARDQLHRFGQASREHPQAATEQLQTTARVAELLVAVRRHDLAAAANVIEALLTRTADTALSAAVRAEYAMARYYSGATDSVESTLRDAVEQARSADLPALELECLAFLAHIGVLSGQFRRSRDDERQAYLVIRRHPGWTPPAALLLAGAERAYLTGAHLVALKGLNRAETVPPEEREADLRAEIAILKGRVYAHIGRYSQARESLSAVGADVGRLCDRRRLATSADIDVRLGRPNAAIDQLRVNGTKPAASDTNLVLARAYRALGDLDASASALRPILTASGGPATRVDLVDALLTQAEINHMTPGQEGGAVECLVRALELAAGEIVQPFEQANASLSNLLSRHPELKAQWPAARLPREPADESAPRRSALTLTLTEPLTNRERSVLRWLSTTMSTGEIADEMCLSVNTVKTHVAAIYRKLAVPRRRDAVLRARELELL